MAESKVNEWLHLEVNGVTYKFKELGLLEVLSMASTFYQKKLRKDLKEMAMDLFADSPSDRVQYVENQQRQWPKGDDLQGQAIVYAESGECQDQFCVYAINRFNRKQVPTLEEADEIFATMNTEDQIVLFTHLFKSFTKDLSDNMEDAKNEKAEGEPGKPQESPV